MTEISLNILDVAENSTKAGAKLTQIEVAIDTKEDVLKVVIADDGCGMNEEQLAKVTDPFYTTRTTRKVGLGVPFFKQAALGSGGTFAITSKVGVGTVVTATFGLSNIDRMPLGDINSTIQSLIVYHLECDFLYTYSVDDKSFSLDTREMKQILGGIPLDSPDVAAYIADYLQENQNEINGGISY